MLIEIPEGSIIAPEALNAFIDWSPFGDGNINISAVGNAQKNIIEVSFSFSNSIPQVAANIRNNIQFRISRKTWSNFVANTPTDQVDISIFRGAETVYTNKVAFTSAAPAAAQVSVPYGHTFTATGSPTFSLDSGSLPPGLTLSAAGALSGTPTQSGSFSFVVLARNAVGREAKQNVTMQVLTAPPQPTPTSTPTPAPATTLTPTPTPVTTPTPTTTTTPTTTLTPQPQQPVTPPKTGDTSTPLAWLCAMMLAAGLALALLKMRTADNRRQ